MLLTLFSLNEELGYVEYGIRCTVMIASSLLAEFLYTVYGFLSLLAT